MKSLGKIDSTQKSNELRADNPILKLYDDINKCSTGNSSLGDEKVYCETCKIEVKASYFSKHKTGTMHLLEKDSIALPKKLHIKPDNPGYKLLVKNGWEYEKGLGINGQGIREPLLPRKKLDRAGIGRKSVQKIETQKNDMDSKGKKTAIAWQEKERSKRLRIMDFLSKEL